MIARNISNSLASISRLTIHFYPQAEFFQGCSIVRIPFASCCAYLAVDHTRISLKKIFTLRSKFFAIAGCTISHNWRSKYNKIVFFIAGRTGCTEHFLQLATNKFLMSVSSGLEFQSHLFCNISNIKILP